MKSHLSLALAAVLALAACSAPGTERERPSSSSSSSSSYTGPDPAAGSDYTGPRLTGLTTDDWNVTVVSDELNYPWEVRISDGTLIVTEVDGTIAMIDVDGGLERHDVRTSDPVRHDGGSGLMGLALADDFADTGTAYIYYTYADGSALANRIAQVHYDGKAWTETRSLLDGIPGHELYNGGRLAIGPDGNLYATTGWVHNEDYPQDRESLAGKILRMNLEGRPASGNPFADSYVYSYGHRNPQGLAWDSAGRLYSAEHGESAHDEINRIVPGGNYGWPLVQDDSRRAGTEAPFISSGDSTWAPSGIAFAGDDLLVAALGAQILYAANEDKDGLAPVFSSGERARAVLPYQDGVYVTSTNTSPRATTRSDTADRLLWIQPTR
ncbi:PQQ-dependent sugar dehydrogenase [Streptomyces corynorhini]|uniref:Sorbosone dehydrogenase family protein n=1 Tax=Streptomyces corynorhini TaxID=2282652 RepID=A0A370B5H5_9ACTN|nr:PQQ-dependent sugar dehydrogenase [Streptomyces corynorhini]RDG37097.1 sorbosone dehydrogenase family protein [Streptomyces corynorhini]